ncbi:MAG: DNA translocase FtsK [Lachnospiraceae bacterium]|nr:DNA translocase FtsK [Lachnospiraceae bacterium]
MAKQKGHRGKRKTKKAAARKNSLTTEIVVILAFAFSVFLEISNFGFGGTMGRALSSVMFGVFGWLEYIFPVLIILACIFIVANKDDFYALLKVLYGFIGFILLCGFVALVYNHDGMGSLKSGYSTGYLMHCGGGFMGNAVTGLLVPNVGLVGAYLVDVVGIIICAILMTERSLYGFLKTRSKMGMEQSKNLREKRKKERALVREEKRAKRAQREYEEEVDTRGRRVAHGVSFDTKIVEENGHSDEMAEVHAKEPYEEPVIHGLTKAEELRSEPVAVEEPKMETPKVEKPKVEAPAVKKEPLVEEKVEMPISSGETGSDADYKFPPIELLKKGDKNATGESETSLKATAMQLEQTLRDFGVNVKMTDVSCGPSVTRFEMQPEHGVKVSKIVGLADDIKLNLAAADIRIEAPIPGKAAVGIEVPNKENVTVMLRELLEAKEYKTIKTKIPFPAGKDIGGKVIVSDIGKMPHVLIAGSTGSGKSVCINTIVMSILYKAKPSEVKLIMIDPKVVELSIYNGIPHLLMPVVTDPKKAAGALNWAVAEMTDRYNKFAEANVRDLKGYNKHVEIFNKEHPDTKLEKMYQLVIIVDEMADLMMVAPGEVEDAICRLAQLARAAGIHLILATQRPSVNVITGLIKANMPSRVAFAVSSGVDSRTILDMYGAEKLLGKGDMLFYPQGYQKPLRVQGAFVSDQEVSDVVEFLKANKPEVVEDTSEIEEKVNQLSLSNKTMAPGTGAATEDGRDVYFADAGRLLIDKERGSIGMLQRMFKIGFNRAARIMDQLEEAGVVGPEEGTKPRKVLLTKEEFENMINDQ